MKKRMIIILIILLTICTIALVIFSVCQKKKNDISKNKTDFEIQGSGLQIERTDLEMLERYLSKKYKKAYKIKEYSFYDNGDIGINAGLHYTFIFDTIDDLNVTGNLDYYELNEENLERVELNITNVDKANKLKKYVEKKSGLSCDIKQFKEEEEKCDYFYITLGNYENYSIKGKIDNGKKVEDARDLEVSADLKNLIEIEVNEQTTILNILEIVKRKNK